MRAINITLISRPNIMAWLKRYDIFSIRLLIMEGINASMQLLCGCCSCALFIKYPKFKLVKP